MENDHAQVSLADGIQPQIVSSTVSATARAPRPFITIKTKRKPRKPKHTSGVNFREDEYFVEILFGGPATVPGRCTLKLISYTPALPLC
jgi:hypothetical protein